MSRTLPASLPVRALLVGIAALALGAAAVWGGDLLLVAAAGTTLLALAAATAERRRDVAALAASERRLSQAHALARMGTWDWDADGDRLAWSDELCRICGVPPGDGPRDLGAYVAMLHPEDRLAMQAEHAGLRDGATGFAFLHRLTCPDGVQRTLRGRAEVVRGPDGRAARLAGTAQDVSGEWDGLQRLQAAEEQFRRVFEDAPIGMVISDLDGRVLRVNAALCALVGHPRERLEGAAREVLAPAEDGHAAAVARARLVAGELGVLELETRLLHADGTPIEILASATLARDELGAPLHVVTQMLDVTERKRFEGQLQYLSDHDPLTGLFNRHRFEHELERELAAATRYGSGGAVLVVDLDHFKYVNDALGHSVGDRLIARVAGAIRARLRRSDVLARLGGDEFAIVLAQVDEDEARLVAESLLDTVRAEGEVGDHDRRRRVSASIGVAMFAHAGDLSAEEVLVEADIAMYDAKEAGRDCVVVFDPQESRQLRMQARLSWAERIRRALDEDRFVLHAQPIVGLGSDRERR